MKYRQQKKPVIIASSFCVQRLLRFDPKKIKYLHVMKIVNIDTPVAGI